MIICCIFQVLEKDDNNLKALMRRGQARLQDGFLELSKKDLKKAQKLDKDNAYIKKLLKICTQKHKEYVKKQQRLYAGMFGKPQKKKGKAGKKKKTKEEVVVENKENDEQTKSDDADADADDANANKMEVDIEKAVSV